MLPALMKPLRRHWKYEPPRHKWPRYYIGELDVKNHRTINRSDVRAFVQQASLKSDNTIGLLEVEKILTRSLKLQKTGLSVPKIMDLFEEIIGKRPVQLQKVRRIDDFELYTAIKDTRVWDPVINIVCYPEPSDKQQKPYELVAKTALVEEFLESLIEKYRSMGFLGGAGQLPGIFGSNEKDNYKIPGWYLAFGEELVRFSKRSAAFRKDVVAFLQKPGTQVNKNEDIVEMMHDIKFCNPRKLWVSERRPNAGLWLDILSAVDLHYNNSS